MKSDLKYYLVGGAVRDHLLGIEAKDKDYVVVGATPQQMIEAGFIQVGKEFPVFLHPETKEEYALARKETKDGKGYKGFKFDFSPNIKLEEDLIRRDLTINAMAMDDQGNITDPYCGQKDLKKQTLKHVSKHFTEDPLRVLRLARFQAQFPQFSIAADTEKLISSMINELEELSADRVFIELKKALSTQTPQLFFETLDHLGALDSVFPEISALKNIEQSKDFHPEGDAFTHTMLVLKEASILSTDFSIRFAALTHDLGKAKTPKDLLPSHTDHEKRSMTIIENLCQRLPIPNKSKQLALIVAQNHFNAHQAFEHKPENLLTLLKQTQALKSDQSIFEKFLICCKADNRGKLSKEYPQEDFLRSCALQLRELDTQDIIKNYQGSEIGKQIEQRQLQLLQKIQRGTK